MLKARAPNSIFKNKTEKLLAEIENAELKVADQVFSIL
jgi:hypothetical protein